MYQEQNHMAQMHNGMVMGTRAHFEPEANCWAVPLIMTVIWGPGYRQPLIGLMNTMINTNAVIEAMAPT